MKDQLKQAVIDGNEATATGPDADARSPPAPPPARS